ncbi:MAG TPA: circularly permuted type 2 ATP-grasp protein [bacterium]
MNTFQSYSLDGFYDELFLGPNKPRPASKALLDKVGSLGFHELIRRQKLAEKSLLRKGITFNVYGHSEGEEKIFPFDVLPRVMEQAEWERLEKGLKQRMLALNLFLEDLYHDKKFLWDKVLPSELVLTSKGFLEACQGITPPLGIWCHIAGMDLVRDKDGTVYVLEDNLRCPSGVSYALENRQVMKRIFPEFFETAVVAPVDDYPRRLLDTLQSLSPARRPGVVVLTPGAFNSAYYEHSFLAQQMGVELVEGGDLYVEGGRVKLRTTQGPQPVDVIYRRIDDDFLDPQVFRPDSMLGVPGLFKCWAEGGVALANAPGTGAADDKAVYAYVPKLIKYYLDEEAILPNVPTYVCWEPAQRDHVLKNLDKMVVKAVNESGGYGMLVGPHADSKQREVFAEKIKAQPRNYIAQPTLALSRAPILAETGLEGRHVDLRPYILSGRETWVTPGGLTRVALKKGSLVVNSSQGGGSKDTWVVLSQTPEKGGRDFWDILFKKETR